MRLADEIDVEALLRRQEENIRAIRQALRERAADLSGLVRDHASAAQELSDRCTAPGGSR